MRLKDVDQDLPILLFFYDEVVQQLETPTQNQKRKVPRKAALDMFLETRSFRKTADAFGVSPSAINQIVYTAFRMARKHAGLTAVSESEE